MEEIFEAGGIVDGMKHAIEIACQRGGLISSDNDNDSGEVFFDSTEEDCEMVLKVKYNGNNTYTIRLCEPNPL